MSIGTRCSLDGIADDLVRMCTTRVFVEEKCSIGILHSSIVSDVVFVPGFAYEFMLYDATYHAKRKDKASLHQTGGELTYSICSPVARSASLVFGLTVSIGASASMPVCGMKFS